MMFRDISYKKSIPDYKPIYVSDENINLFNPLREGEKVSCLKDNAFKLLIANTKKTKYLVKLLSLIFDITEEEILENMKFSKNEFDKRKLKDTSYRGDCTIELNGSYIQIEINRVSVEERNLRYLDRLCDSKIYYDGGYGFPKGCYLINISNYTYPICNESIEVYELQDRRRKLLSFCKQVMNIYVPNIMKKYYNKEELSELERWVLVMSITNIKEARKVAGSDKKLNEFIDDAIKVSYRVPITEEDERKEYDDAYLEMRCSLAKNEGVEQGIEKNKNEMVHKMFLKGFSAEDISNTLEINLDYVNNILASN